MSVRARDVTPASPAGTIRLHVERSLLDLRQLDPTVGAEGGWCSLVGRISEPAPEVPRFPVGTRVAAIAPPCDTAVVAQERCFPLPPALDVGSSAYWALLHVLLFVVRSLSVELGHWILIHGGGMTGRILCELATACGALVVGIDPRCDERAAGTGAWVNGLDAARSLLPRDGADAVVDLSFMGEDNARLLTTVRTGGRVLIAGGPQRIDLDLYPDVHRRSLHVRGCNLSSHPIEVGRYAADERFLLHLLDRGRLVLAEPDVSQRAATLQAAPVTLRDDANSLMVEWDDAAG